MINNKAQTNSNVFSSRFKSVNVSSPLDLPNLNEGNQTINISRFNSNQKDSLDQKRKQNNMSSLMEIQVNDNQKKELALYNDADKVMV